MMATKHPFLKWQWIFSLCVFFLPLSPTRLFPDMTRQVSYKKKSGTALWASGFIFVCCGVRDASHFSLFFCCFFLELFCLASLCLVSIWSLHSGLTLLFSLHLQKRRSVIILFLPCLSTVYIRLFLFLSFTNYKYKGGWQSFKTLC